MPTVIFMMVIMSLVAYAALVASNNSLNLSYKQSYIGMARVASKGAIDYAQEQFDTNSSYNGTAETTLASTTNYRLTFTVAVLSTSADGYTKTVRGTGSVYLPKLSSTAKYVFDVRAEVVRTYAIAKTPDNFGPTLWLDASDTSSLFGQVTNTIHKVTTFGTATQSTRDTLQELASNGSQTASSWQNQNMQMSTCSSGDFTSTICSSSTTKYLYNGVVFQGVNIPQGATITSATITLPGATPAGSNGSLTNQLFGVYQASNNPYVPLFTSSGSNQLKNMMVNANQHTAASATITTNNLPPGNSLSFDIKNVVQEIVNHPQWGQNIADGKNDFDFMGFGIQRTAGAGSRNLGKDGITLDITYTSTNTALAANGASVAQWNDKSGNGNHAIATHGTPPTRQDNALNSKSVVRFGGGGDMLSSLLNAISGHNVTVIAVTKPNTSSASNARFISLMNTTDTNDTTANSIAALTRSSNTSTVLSRYNTDSNTVNVSNVVNGTPGILSLTYAQGENATLRYNGAYATGDSTALNYNANQIWIAGNRSGSGVGGGVNYFNGDMAEIVVYNYRLTCHQIASIEDGLRTKWGISASPWADSCPAENIPTL
jgi:hypothetical protein